MPHQPPTADHGGDPTPTTPEDRRPGPVRARPAVAPPAALVPPPPDPAEHEQRVLAAVDALECVRDRLLRTRRSLDVFISEITRIPAPEPGTLAAPAPEPAVVAPAPTPPAPLDATTGTPVALAAHVLPGTTAGPAPVGAATRRTEPDRPATTSAAVAGPATDRVGRPPGPRRTTTPPEAGVVSAPVALSAHVLPPAGPSEPPRLGG